MLSHASSSDRELPHQLTRDIDDPGADEVGLVADEDDGLVHAGARVPEVAQRLLGLLDRLQAVHAVHHHHGVGDVRRHGVLHLQGRTNGYEEQNSPDEVAWP